ncbi:hypothetical protein [Pinibacter aurantiacus]|uniref:Uncharacterized protein n=1 Tax=Pinibacter aurantiacus TaxID=2851599 RepID=A0A9E2SCH6_9BACT|nr:hypothetical protein [Pinibacter aurantiacus]MBV4358792.1 hypothetical protein [Pinibacter aurantiacus]
MYHLISWTTYIKATAIWMTLCYLIIGAKFFKYEILRLFGIRKISKDTNN